MGSSWHSYLACASGLLKVRLGVLSRLGEDGNGAVTETAGAAVSTVNVSVAEVSCGWVGSECESGVGHPGLYTVGPWASGASFSEYVEPVTVAAWERRR